MDGLAAGKILENAFEDPFFNVWNYLTVRDLVATSMASKEIKEKSVFGFIANEIFSAFQLPLVFDNSQDYDLRQLLLQLKRFSTVAPALPVVENTVQQGSTSVEEDEGIFLLESRLESASFDEYDDFTPRHPVPRDKVHRRGDSLFNSDITEVGRLVGDPTISAAVRKFAHMKLSEVESGEHNEQMRMPEVSPHVPTFRNTSTDGNMFSVFTFE